MASFLIPFLDVQHKPLTYTMSVPYIGNAPYFLLRLMPEFLQKD